MGHRRLRTLGEQDGDPVATPYAEAAKRVGEAVGQVLEAGEAEGLDSAMGGLMDQRQPVAVACPFVANIDADVIALRNVPAKTAVHRVITVAGLEHVGPPRGCIVGAYG